MFYLQPSVIKTTSDLAVGTHSLRFPHLEACTYILTVHPIVDIEKMSLQNPYACAVCRMAFSTPKVLQIHVQVTHSSANVCQKPIITGKKYIDVKVRTKNVSSSENSDRKKTLDNTKHYEIKEISISKKKLEIDIQSKEKMNKSELDSCKYCEKKFSQQRSLKAHERIHTGEKSYSCKYCEKKFSQQHLVKQHERIHTGEKPFSCKYCEKKFSQQHSAKEHERIHTGEKPYSCKNCNYRSNNNSNLKKHEMKVHANEKQRTAIANQQIHKI